MIGKRFTVTPLTLKLSVRWIGDQTLKKKLGTSFREQSSTRENSLEETTRLRQFSRRKTEDRLIGGCGIVVSNPDNRSAYVGYVLNRDDWGQGYATETGKALLAFGFEQLRLQRVWATCDMANAASAHVLEKAGMQREGRLREHKWAKGRWRDSFLYAILDHEWRNFKASQKS